MRNLLPCLLILAAIGCGASSSRPVAPVPTSAAIPPSKTAEPTKFDREKIRTEAEWNAEMINKTTDKLMAMMGAPKTSMALEADKVPWWIYPVKFTRKGKEMQGPMMLRIIGDRVLEVRF